MDECTNSPESLPFAVGVCLVSLVAIQLFQILYYSLGYNLGY
jgi:hypothetical protein